MDFDSSIFDNSQIEPGSTGYTVDSIISAIGLSKSYEIDAILGNIGTTSYLVSALIRQEKATYSYLLDAVVVLDKLNDPRFKESIINSIMISLGRACDAASQAIASMGIRMQLPYASPEDLDEHWATILGLRRRSEESDESFRSRLMTRLYIMKSSGTIPEISTIIDTILGIKNASTLTPYWPGDLVITWNSYEAMRAGEAKYPALKEALDNMVAAGFSWITHFPYKEYSVDALVFGEESLSYFLDAGVEKPKTKIYRISADIFDTGTAPYDLDGFLEIEHTISERLDFRGVAERVVPYSLDALGETSHWKDYSLDGDLEANLSEPESVDAIVEKTGIVDYYHLDAMAEGKRKGFYLISAAVVEE